MAVNLACRWVNASGHVPEGFEIFELISGPNHGIKESKKAKNALFILLWISCSTAKSNHKQSWHGGKATQACNFIKIETLAQVFTSGGSF